MYMMSMGVERIITSIQKRVFMSRSGKEKLKGCIANNCQGKEDGLCSGGFFLYWQRIKQMAMEFRFLIGKE